MKIAFDAKRALNNATGLGSYSRNLIQGLMEYYTDNQYLLLSPKVREDYYNELQGNFELILPENKWHRALKGLWRSYWCTGVLKQRDVDVYHGLSNELPYKLDEKRIKKVVTIHDVLYKSHPGLYPFVDRQIYDRKVRYACAIADIIVATSEATKREIVKYYKADAKKIKVVFQAVSPLFFEENRQEVPGINLPDKYILQVGSFSARKNHLLTLKAYAGIRDKVQEKLVFAGIGGATLAAVREYVKGNKLENYVVIMEGVPNEALPALYQRATLSVYPSVAEGFGLPVAESMVCGTPVITTMGSCMEEVAGYAAWYSTNEENNLSEKLLYALTNEADYNNKKAACNKRRHEFHPQTFATNMMGIYTSQYNLIN